MADFAVGLGGLTHVCGLPLPPAILTGDVALDWETAVWEDPAEIPVGVLASVSDGKHHGILLRSHMSDLIRHVAGGGQSLVMQNAAYDLWVTEDVLLDSGDEEGVRLLRGMIDGGRVFDTMLMDRLVLLALGDPVARNRDLGTIAGRWLGPAWALDKSDVYRMRYGELLGQDLLSPAIDPGFLTYAVRDAICTWHIAREMRDCVSRLIAERGYPLSPRWGPLSHDIQVRAAWALAKVTRNGMHVDSARLDALRAGLWDSMLAGVADLEEVIPPGHSGPLFRRWKRGPKDGSAKAGDIVLTESGTPSKSDARLRDVLEAECGGNGWEVPRAEKGGVSLAAGHWEQWRAESLVIDRMLAYEDLAKLYSWTAQLATTTDVVHPRYDGPKTTGRTSAFRPSIQNAPKAGDFRHLFTAREGHAYLIADYSAIEMVTLASVLLDLYGSSVLADVLRGGRDPHAFTAAMLLGIAYEEFKDGLLSPATSDEYKLSRQRAKVVNFGVPGGMGAANLAAYALRNYGVEMTPDEAKAFRNRLTREVYPEIGRYLEDDPFDRLAAGLNRPREDVASLLGNDPWTPYAARKILSGDTRKADGEQYALETQDAIWTNLRLLWRNRPVESGITDRLGASNRTGQQLLREKLNQREAGSTLERLAFRRDVILKTGRVRGCTYYTESKNGPFQGLAADGAVSAVYRLVAEGYRVAAFIHDEILVELPHVDKMSVSALDVGKIVSIMVTEMANVVGHGLPVGVEYAVSSCWSKRAKRIDLGDRVGVWMPGEMRNEP